MPASPAPVRLRQEQACEISGAWCVHGPAHSRWVWRVWARAPAAGEAGHRISQSPWLIEYAASLTRDEWLGYASNDTKEVFKRAWEPKTKI